MTTYEKIVKGATKVKIAAPKPKYIEPILMATLADHPGEMENLHTIMRTLETRLNDSAWSVVYKALIVVHIMIREGDKDAVLEYLSHRLSSMLNLLHSNIAKQGTFNTDVRFIVSYSKYLHVRVKQYDETGVDYVRDERSNNSTSQNGGRLRTLSVDKGLLREAESVQKQIDGLLKNNFVESDVNNDIVLTAFRLLVNDLLGLFQELNEAVINLLEHYFEMSRYDAERALKIYKKFVDQTKYVIDYLRVAKHLEHATKLHVPTIKHAPTALTSSLEEYLDDPNFEENRRQYLLEKLQKKKGQNGTSLPQKAPDQPKAATENLGHQRTNTLLVHQSTFNPWAGNMPQQQYVPVELPPQNVNNGYAVQQAQQTGGYAMPAIVQGQVFQGVNNGQNQALQAQQVPQQQVPQQQTLQPLQQQQTQSFQANINPTFTGAGFGGYGPQVASQQTGSNPFMQNGGQQAQQFQQQQTHQFQPQIGHDQPIQQQPIQQQSTQQFGLSRTGTNPFSTGGQGIQPQNTNPFGNTRFASGSSTTALSFNKNTTQPVAATSTGNNPFKVSQTTTNLFNNASAQPAQQPIKAQPTAGGLERLPTIPVFPETQQNYQKEMYVNNARNGLQQQTTGFQQATGFQPQGTGFQQQNNPFPQNDGFQQQQFTGAPQQNSAFQQQPQLQQFQIQVPVQQQQTQPFIQQQQTQPFGQQQFPQQQFPQQQQPQQPQQAYGSTYEGPSLI